MILVTIYFLSNCANIGGAYLPIESAFPDFRISSILSDANPQAVIVQVLILYTHLKHNLILLQEKFLDRFRTVIGSNYLLLTLEECSKGIIVPLVYSPNITPNSIFTINL